MRPKNHRYGQWVGNPKGRQENPALCVEEVSDDNRAKKEWVCLLELTGSCQGPRILEGEAARALAHLVYGPWSGDVVEYISDGGGWHDDAVDVVDDGDDVRFVGINGWKNVTEQTRKILGVWYLPSKWPEAIISGQPNAAERRD